MQLGGDGEAGRGAEGRGGDRELVRRRGGEVGEEAQDLGGIGEVVDHAAGDDLRAHGMQPVLQRGDDPEVPAAAAQAPEQVGVLVGARRHPLAVGGDDLRGEQVVARGPVLAGDPAEPAAEGQPGHAGERDVAGRGGEAEGLRRPVDVAEQRAGAHARRPRDGVDLDRPLGREVDDHAGVAHGVAGDVVAPAAHGQRQPVLAREAHAPRRRRPRARIGR